jgi:hypothetical protein
MAFIERFELDGGRPAGSCAMLTLHHSMGDGFTLCHQLLRRSAPEGEGVTIEECVLAAPPPRTPRSAHGSAHGCGGGDRFVRSGRDLINMAKSRTNVIPIIEDARHPLKYRMLMGMVDTIFADVAQPDQARIVALNAGYFLKNGGHFVISIKASCIDSTAPAEAVFAREVKKLQQDNLKPKEQLTLEPYERDHAVVVGVYRAPPK